MKLKPAKRLWVKTFLIFAAGAALLCFLFSVVYHRITVFTERSTNELFENTVYQVSQRCITRVDQAEDMIYGISNNRRIKNYISDLEKGDTSWQLARVRILRDALQVTNIQMADNVYVILRDGRLVNCYYGEAKFAVEDRYMDYLEAPLQTAGDGQISWNLLEDPYELEAVTYINDGARVWGLLVVQFDANLFDEIFTYGRKNVQEELALTDDSGRILYAKNQDLIGSSLEELSIPESIRSVEYDLGYYGWKLYGAMGSGAVMDRLLEIMPLLFAIFIVIAVMLVVTALLIYRSLLRPVSQIMHGMEEVRNGNLDCILTRKRQDEFGIIIDNYNDMVIRLRELLDAVQRQYNNYYKLELNTLKSKLNPHFLYNAFDMIYWRLILKDEYEIADVVVALANILRYSVSNEEEFVTIREDREYISSYLLFWQMLMDGKLDYKINIPEELLDYRMPKLLLQPLVENAIKYAFDETGGKLYISVEESGDYLIFRVEDNGRGIPPEKKKQILESGGGGGYGVGLVKATISAAYEDDCGIDIRDGQVKGTVISVRIRKERERESKALHR